MPDFKVGTITHYYDKIGVGVIELIGPLSVGDTIRISGHGKEFTQLVNSIQVEHESIQTAKNGQVGLKIEQEVKDGDEVFKVGS